MAAQIRGYMYEKFKMFRFKRDADALVVENPFVKERLQSLYDIQNVHVVYNTYNQIFTNREKWDCSKKLSKFNGITLLTISSYYPHKNLEILVDTAKELRASYPDFSFRFVLTIEREQLHKDLTGVDDCFVFLGKVSIAQCPFLYTQCDFMILPTLLECFSAAWAEAMIMNTPIITSDFPFSRGICKNAAIYVDPTSPEGIAKAIYDLSSSKNKQIAQIENEKMVRLIFPDQKARMKKYLDIIADMLL